MALAPTVFPRTLAQSLSCTETQLPIGMMEIINPENSIPWQTLGREAERGGKIAAGVQALLCVMLGKEAETNTRIREAVTDSSQLREAQLI